MSYANDMGFYAYDEDNFGDTYDRRYCLVTGIHIDKSGREVDVRLIDTAYATNLYRWYLRNNPLSSEQALLESRLMKLLYEKIKGVYLSGFTDR